MNSERILPFFQSVHIDQYASQMKLEIEAARLAMQPEPLLSFDNNEEISFSLSDFLGKMNCGRLHELVVEHKKSGLQRDVEGFVVSKPLPQGSVNMSPPRRSKFYVDGVHGFGLGFRQYEDEHPLWLAVTSFSRGVDIPAVIHSPAGKSLRWPVIMQLQGPSWYTYANSNNKEKASEILSQIQWERLLVNVIMEWAYEVNAPDLYMLPGSMNRWVGPANQERFKLRYDKTAERMGFRKRPNGMYGIVIN